MVTAERLPKLGKKFNRLGLPPKIGSLQTFVSGYRDADYWLRRWDDSLSETSRVSLCLKFAFIKHVNLISSETCYSSEITFFSNL